MGRSTKQSCDVPIWPSHGEEKCLGAIAILLAALEPDCQWSRYTADAFSFFASHPHPRTQRRVCTQLSER